MNQQSDSADAPARRIVIVEDNSELREMLAELLSVCGHEVQVAATGREALAVIAATAPDVALVDIGLPDLDGCEVARRIRGEAVGQRLQLVGADGSRRRRRSSDGVGRRFRSFLGQACRSGGTDGRAGSLIQPPAGIAGGDSAERIRQPAADRRSLPAPLQCRAAARYLALGTQAACGAKPWRAVAPWLPRSRFGLVD